MKSKFDLKHDIAYILPENQDDLWILTKILEKNAIITAKTERSIIVQRGEEKEKVGKRTITLSISLEKIEFEGNRLRLGGKIIEGPEDIEKGWHTIEIKPLEEFKIKQKWKSWQIDKIKSAEIIQEPIIVCILDEIEADIWLITNKSKYIAGIKSPGTGKGLSESRENEFFGKVFSVLKEQKAKYFVIAGPGFAKENFKKWIENKGFQEKIYYTSTPHTGKPGLQEILKSGFLKKIVKESRISLETEIIENFFTELAKNTGLVEYGLKNVENAIENNAVKTLLIVEDKVKEYENLIEKAEKFGAKVIIVSSEHESGEKLLNLGGIAAFLRFSINYNSL
ncbi:MAG: mRNA surveillance protein pelota [Candidatus Aenigmatarchaeota archaeon]|nr:mRNA surveillance protein pelota [Candidatus Aenigmarchaeota archaeon]